MIRVIVGCAFVVFAVGCTWVKPSEEGAAVAILTAEEVVACERIGRTTAMSAAKVAGVKRSAKKLETELATIARNRAAELGGDAISTLAPVDGNEQVFAIFKCSGD